MRSVKLLNRTRYAVMIGPKPCQNQPHSRASSIRSPQPGLVIGTLDCYSLLLVTAVVPTNPAAAELWLPRCAGVHVRYHSSCVGISIPCMREAEATHIASEGRLAGCWQAWASHPCQQQTSSLAPGGFVCTLCESAAWVHVPWAFNLRAMLQAFWAPMYTTRLSGVTTC